MFARDEYDNLPLPIGKYYLVEYGNITETVDQFEKPNPYQVGEK